MLLTKFSGKTIEGEIQLPSSKSISNRALFLAALSDHHILLENLSQCDDTQAFIKVITAKNGTIDVGAAGTAMRFAAAFLSQKHGEWLLTGSERMKNRPIGVLVEALRQLGADISYTEKEGFPPLKISGKKLKGGTIEINSSVSSQYISALMMLAISLDNGLIIRLKGEPISQSYVLMTQKIMSDFGFSVEISGNQISVKNGVAKIDKFRVESDWSAASYWYELLAINGCGRLLLNGLSSESYQGDDKIAELFDHYFGIKTDYLAGKIAISPTQVPDIPMVYDFVNEPDMAQTFAVCCCLTNKKFHFSGLQSLRIKETDRVAALVAELAKLGYILTVPKEGELCWNGEKTQVSDQISIATYSDHRMAMAFAPAMIRFSLNVENQEVVTKSYPTFWRDFEEILYKE